MVDAGCRILDTGCWILDAGSWILDAASKLASGRLTAVGERPEGGIQGLWCGLYENNNTNEGK
ncbi:MAG: hypothetical protein EOP48_19730 [Sphingobacteriales bacterium]|nr:MAG: hypothetical protein EOP48_19730 [Sphingobacteriales bacterium]